MRSSRDIEKPVFVFAHLNGGHEQTQTIIKNYDSSILIFLTKLDQNTLIS